MPNDIRCGILKVCGCKIPLGLPSGPDDQGYEFLGVQIQIITPQTIILVMTYYSLGLERPDKSLALFEPSESVAFQTSPPTVVQNT